MDSQKPPQTLSHRAITFRAVLLGLLLIPPNCLWIVWTEVVRYAGHPTTMSLFFNVVFCLVLLVLVNLGVRQVAPRWALTQGELLVVYTILSLGSCMVGHDMYQVVIAGLVHPFQYATPENKWQLLFFHYLPKWLMVSNPQVLKGYFQGHSSLYQADHLRAWLGPVVLWTGFFMALIWTMMGLNVLLRRQWSERERLTFPIIALPLELTQPGMPLLRNRLMWTGFAVAAAIDILNNLNANFPIVPRIPVRTYDLSTYLVNRPWNAIGWTPLAFFPAIIGLGFLLPLDLSFSCWFFYWYWKAQRMITTVFGWQATRPDMPYINDQSAGAFLGVAFFALWIGRLYFKEIGKSILGRPSEVTSQGEPISYRTAAIGVVGGFILVTWFFHAAGMSLGITVASFLIYFALSLAVTRMRAEMGTPAHDLHYAGPDQMIPRVVGIENLSPRDLTVFSLWWGFNRAYRTHPMPHQLEGFKLAERIGFRYRPFFWVMLGASLFGSLAAFWALLHVYYDVGAASAKCVGPSVWFGWEPYNRLAAWLTVPPQRDELSAVFTGVGFVGAVFLMGMRLQLLRWPFHPVGYAVSSSWAMNWMWLSIFLAWLAKAGLLRWGGLKGYRTALPFFLGLILGEFMVGSIANILGIVGDWQIYRFWG